MTEDSKKKTILFFCVKTFGIQDVIVEGLRKNNFHVIYYDERPSNNFLTKSLIRLNKNFIKRRIDRYYNSILKRITEDDRMFDFLFVIRGEVIPEWFLRKVKNILPNIKLIYYTWDSFQNNPNGLKVLSLFDSKFSFDPKDCHDFNLKLRPLFFSEQFSSCNDSKILTPKFILSFVGTLHSDRFSLFQKIAKKLQSNGETYGYFYIQNILVYFYRVYIERSLNPVPLAILSFKSISPESIRTIYNNSQFILDVNHPNQNGLTMRTIEVIGLRKQLITTNSQIKKYKFYNPESFLVLNGNDDLDADKLKIALATSKTSISEVYYRALTLNGWIESIFIKSEPPEFWITNY